MNGLMTISFSLIIPVHQKEEEKKKSQHTLIAQLINNFSPFCSLFPDAHKLRLHSFELSKHAILYKILEIKLENYSFTYLFAY